MDEYDYNSLRVGDRVVWDGDAGTVERVARGTEHLVVRMDDGYLEDEHYSMFEIEG